LANAAHCKCIHQVAAPVEVGSEVYSEEALTPMLASYANMYFEI